MSKFNPYEVMGVAVDASPAIIQQRYRFLAKVAHPDKGGDREKWDRLQLANNVLSDPERRAHYDATGRIDGLPNDDFERQQAFTMIAERIAALADSYVRADFSPRIDPRAMPVLETIRRQISQERDKHESALTVGRKSLAFMADYAKRLTRQRGVGVDQVAVILKEKIAGIEDRVAQVEGAMRVLKVALDLLDEYDFASDPPQQTYTVTMPGVMAATGVTMV